MAMLNNQRVDVNPISKSNSNNSATSEKSLPLQRHMVVQEVFAILRQTNQDAIGELVIRPFDAGLD